MSRYNAAGKRLSSMTHARRSHQCPICPETPSGNGGVVSHGRGHVRRGEAVELISRNGTRAFVAVTDVETIERLVRAGWSNPQSADPS